MTTSGAEVYGGNLASMTVTSGGRIVDTTVSSGGRVTVSRGGVSDHATVHSGGSLYVSSGASTSNTVITETTAQEVVYNGGVTHATSATNQGGQTVSNGGVASDTYLFAGEHEFVFAGGRTVNLVASGAGSYEQVMSGGISSDTVLRGGAVEMVAARGSGYNTQVGSGSVLSVGNGATISGTTLSLGGAIDVSAIAYDANDRVTLVGNVLTVSNAVYFPLYTTTLSGDYTNRSFRLSCDADGDTLITEVCFLAGSMIETPSGERAVEALVPGDTVVTYEDGVAVERALTWVGRRHVSVRAGMAEDEAGYPVRIRKDAIADGVPHRDLLVTAEHALFLDGAFVPARMLVNGSSIAYDTAIAEYDYFHVETERHAVIRANGLMTESYLDTGIRATFVQGAVGLRQVRPARSWGRHACARLDVLRETVEPLHREIAQRADAMGLATRRRDVTLHDDSDLHLVTQSGQVLRPTRQNDTRVVFALPQGCERVWVVSNTARPSRTIGPFVDDRRDLGVLVGAVTLWESDASRPVTSYLSGDQAGWSVAKATACRWTLGRALLELGARNEAGPTLLSLEILAGGPYEMTDTGRLAISA